MSPIEAKRAAWPFQPVISTDYEVVSETRRHGWTTIFVLALGIVVMTSFGGVIERMLLAMPKGVLIVLGCGLTALSIYCLALGRRVKY